MDKFKYFNSLGQFSKYLAETRVLAGFKSDQASKNGCQSFTGTASWDEAEALFIKGDKKAADAIMAEGFSKVTAKGYRNQRQLYSSRVGIMPHVPNYIAGRPNSMINVRTNRVPSPVINVLYNISNNAGISAADMRVRAIRLLAALYNIECSGTRVNLYLCDISSIDDVIGWVIKLKDSGQPFDILKMAYPLTNPSMLRRHSFRFTEVFPHEGYGYGRAVHGTASIKKIIPLCRGAEIKSVHYSTLGDKTIEQIQSELCR